jgi:uncharacterized protein
MRAHMSKSHLNRKTRTTTTLYAADTGRNGTGKGLFTSVDIKKGQLIFTWEGEKKVLVGKYPWWMGSRWLQVGKHEYIDTARYSPGWYVNHSCNPNAGVKGSIDIVAIRDIKAGEQVTVDYSLSMDSPGESMICHCGQKNCRTLILSYEHLPAALKRRYRGYTSEFLLRGQ